LDEVLKSAQNAVNRGRTFLEDKPINVYSYCLTIITVKGLFFVYNRKKIENEKFFE